MLVSTKRGEFFKIGLSNPNFVHEIKHVFIIDFRIKLNIFVEN